MGINVIKSCSDCPFNGQDNIYCRTCSIPFREALRQLSDVQKMVVAGVVRYSLGAPPSAFGMANPKPPAAGVGSLPPRAPLGLRSQTCPVVYVVQYNLYICSGKEVLFMSNEEKEIKIEQANKLAKWFKIYFEITIFGHVIFSKTWPPQE